MDKLRLINLFAIAFLVTLLVQYFLPKESTVPVNANISISVEKDSVVIPNIPKISIHNTTSGAITIKPCDDIAISIDSRPLTGIRESASEFCTPITISGASVAHFSLNPLYKIFSSQPGKYLFILKTSLGEKPVDVDVSAP